ncbi:hypothetical protein DRE_01154 [Drechslerella stenobrocha 248]|uniref:Uncharacterized protein n=1 Tax=Drechslerella stenobrocha 248 TaxID=1043628 RepID=W7HWM0_9PEZI|nr:hypothetical protein DRE_01154 [Drechslerella stenobrocha 248]
MKTLQLGQYYIIAYEDWIGGRIIGDRLVGRHPIEDRSLQPKAIYRLPPGIKPHSPWVIDPNDQGGFIFEAGGATVGARGDQLVAILYGEEDYDKNWFIEPARGGNGAPTYTVRSERGEFWTVDRVPFPQGHRIVLRQRAPGDDQSFVLIRVDNEAEATDASERENGHSSRPDHNRYGKGYNAENQDRVGARRGGRDRQFCA